MINLVGQCYLMFESDPDGLIYHQKKPLVNSQLSIIFPTFHKNPTFFIIMWQTQSQSHSESIIGFPTFPIRIAKLQSTDAVPWVCGLPMPSPVAPRPDWTMHLRPSAPRWRCPTGAGVGKIDWKHLLESLKIQIFPQTNLLDCFQINIDKPSLTMSLKTANREVAIEVHNRLQSKPFDHWMHLRFWGKPVTFGNLCGVP